MSNKIYNPGIYLSSYRWGENEEFHLTPDEQTILRNFIEMIFSPSRTAQPSRKTMAGWLGKSERHVTRCLNRLKKDGFLEEKSRRGFPKTSSYRLTLWLWSGINEGRQYKYSHTETGSFKKRKDSKKSSVYDDLETMDFDEYLRQNPPKAPPPPPTPAEIAAQQREFARTAEMIDRLERELAEETAEEIAKNGPPPPPPRPNRDEERRKSMEK